MTPGLLTPELIPSLSDADLAKLTGDLEAWQKEDRKLNALYYYVPVSERAREIHRCQAKTVGIFGGNRCLPLTAPVLMANGSWTPLGEIHIGDRIMAADPMTGEAVPANVTATHQAGRKEVFRVTFSDGGYLDATEDHLVPSYARSGCETGRGKPLHPAKRRLGDYLAGLEDRSVSKRLSFLSPRNIQCESHDKLQMSPYLLGAILGDGSITKRGVKFTGTNPYILNRISSACDELGLKLKAYSDKEYGLSAGNTGRPNRLYRELQRHGLIGKGCYTKFIPPAAWGLDREGRLQLLAGLVDTDGSEDQFSSCSERLAHDFIQLIRSLGGKATLTPRISSCQTGAIVHYFQIYWRLNDPIPLAASYKQLPPTKRAVNYTRRICRSAASIGMQECGDLTVDHPAHCYITGDWVMVSNSGKTTTPLVEAVALATGTIPASLATEPRFLGKFKGPLQVRVICSSITTNLHQVMLRKLKWWMWNGSGRPGSLQGHYGWVPKDCLIDGQWESSWSEKLRTLRLLYRKPENPAEVEGESSIQFMSSEQDVEHHASSEFDLIILDEPPPYEVYQESIARVISKGGRIFIDMTWPSDPTAPVDWLFDEVYDKKGDPNVAVFNLFMTENPNIDQAEVSLRAAQMTETERQIRVYGQPIRFSNRIHPTFTDQTQTWCFACGKVVIAHAHECLTCHGTETADFSHVEGFKVQPLWPVVCLLDPHPRKPHMLAYWAVDPSDDLWCLGELLVEGTCEQVKRECDLFEQDFRVQVVQRLMDPNMGRSVSGSDRSITWQDEFAAVGLPFDLADDSDVGRQRVNGYLIPDRHTLRPRMIWHPRNEVGIRQFKRYCWDEDARSEMRGLKQRPKPQHDDFPTLAKYLLNSNPTFSALKHGGTVYRRPGHRSAVGY